ncbi:hypothetical protein [Haladaptatus sp. DYF46]|nr:hypothetical protein [Haladaptatus sp. DYF46]
MSLIETLVETLKPPDGQTSLGLYQHVNPDALEELQREVVDPLLGDEYD